MVSGPLGRELILVDDDKNVLVLLGIDGGVVERSRRNVLEDTVESDVIDKANEGHNKFIKEVNLTVNTDISKPLSQKLNDARYLQQYEVQTSLEEMPQPIVNAIHNTVVEVVDDLGYNITGTRTTIV